MFCRVLDVLRQLWIFVAPEMLMDRLFRLTEGLAKGMSSRMQRKYKMSAEFEGKTYSATYYVTGRMVIVESTYGREGMQRGGSKPEDVARMLLLQLLRAAKVRPT